MKAIVLWGVDCKENLKNLPKEIEIPDGMTDEDKISDYISNTTGFCHCGFALEEDISNIREILKQIREGVL